MATASVPVEEDRDLECPVCHEPFRTPKILPCGHTICLSPCLQQLAKERDSLKCPECRADHHIPDGTVERFPTNILIVRLMKADMAQKKPVSSVCPLCNSEEPLVKCFHCSGVVCERCRMAHTKELQAEVLKFMRDCAKGGDFVEETAVKQASTALQDQVHIYADTIQTTVATLVEAVQQRGEKLLEKVSEYERHEEAAILDRVEDVKDQINHLHKFCTEGVSEMNASGYTPTQNQLLKAKQGAADQLTRFEKAKSNIANIREMDLSIGIEKLLSTIQKLGDFKEVGSREDDDTVDDASFMNEHQPQATENQGKPSTEKISKGIKDEKAESTDSSHEVAGPSSAPQPTSVISLSKRDCSEVKMCLGRKGRENGQFDGPSCLVVCPRSGNIVVGESYFSFNRCQVFNATGEHVKTLTKCVDDFSWISDIAISNSGRMYVMDSNKLHIFKYPMETVKSVGFSGDYYSICTDPDGRVHVCRGKDGVDVYNEQGKRCEKYTVDARGTFDARQIAISSKKNIYITNVWSKPEQHYLYVLNECYQLVQHGKFGNIPTEIKGQTVYCFYPGKMRIIEDMYILVTHMDSHSVYLFDLNWKLVKRFGVEGHCRGQIYHPVGADVTKDGELVVISKNNMLQFF